jgi:hypothetical protein
MASLRPLSAVSGVGISDFLREKSMCGHRGVTDDVLDIVPRAGQAQ